MTSTSCGVQRFLVKTTVWEGCSVSRAHKPGLGLCYLRIFLGNGLFYCARERTRSTRTKGKRKIKEERNQSCLVPRRHSFDENVRANEGRKETTGETCFACRLYPSHGPLRFITSHSRFVLASAGHAKKEVPEEEAGTEPSLFPQ